MVRETRYLWAGNLPDKSTEEDLAQHFQRYGKIQSVKFISDDGGKAAVVAFMDIKSASKAHGSENKLEGKVLETQYTEASGKGTKVTRTAFESESAPVVSAPPPSRYEAPSKQGYEGYGYSSYYSGGGGGGREADAGERWSGGGGGGETDYYQQQERGRPRQRYPAPPPQQYSAPYSQHKQFEGHYAAYDKYGGVPRGKAGQSPGKPEAMPSRSAGKLPKGYGDSPSRSRSSSSSSCGSHSTGTSHSRRSSSKTSRERKRSSVVVPVKRKEDADKLGLLLRGFPPRSSDTSIRDGLFHEYKKCGKVMSVSITGEKENRFAIVTFKKSEDASKALEQARAKVFFGRKVTAEPHDGVDDSEADYRPPEAELDEYHHKATRTLFVGNLQLDISKETLKDIFRRYGMILDIDIKNQQPNQVFAFVQFDNIKSVVHALHEMDGETIGSSKVKLGFGRSMPTNVLWVDNVTEQVQESYLKRQFCRVGPVNYVLIDRETCRALVFYDSNELALASLSAMRGRALANKKIQIDFASIQCMNSLMDNMESTSQLRPEDRPDQKGFRQYPQPPPGGATTAPEPATYEERPGYDRSKGFYYEGENFRGRGGKFRGQYAVRGGRTYYQGYDENYKGKRFEEGYEEEGGKHEDFDRELREYGYKQKERSDVEGDSPYSRGARFEEYKDDAASQDSRPKPSAAPVDMDTDKDGTVAHKKYEDTRYSRDSSLEERKREKVRVYSSPNSEFSQRGSTNQRSPSSSPARRSRRTSRDVTHAAYSPSSPSRHSSPELTSPKKLTKEQKPDYTPSTTLISEIQRTRPRKHSLKRESESDLSELDKALQRGDLFESPPKKRQAREENMDRARNESSKTISSAEYNKLKAAAEREQLRKATSGSHSKVYSGANVDTYNRDDRTKNPPPPFSVQQAGPGSHYVGEPAEPESKFSTPSPSTKSTKSESDKTPDSSERHSAVSSHSSGEMAQLEQEKLRLLSELHDIEDGSTSDGEIRDEEDPRTRRKKPRLEEVFDLDWSPSDMKKWREEAIRREKQQADGTPGGQENREPHPKNSHTQPPPKPPEPPGGPTNTTTTGATTSTTTTGSGKFKPIDNKKSLRKQMEAMRREHEQDTASRRSSQDSKSGDGSSGDGHAAHQRASSLGQDMETGDNSMDSGSAGKTPRHDSTEFRKKAGQSSSASDFPKVKGQRSYRTNMCADEMAKDDQAKKRDKSEEQKSRRYSDLDKMGKSPAVNRSESSESKQSGQEVDKDQHSRRTSRENSEGLGRKDGHSSRRDRSGDSKKSHRDLRSEPCIIPEYPVKGTNKDGSDKRIVLQDPRKDRDRRRQSPMSLPLPKFFKYVKKGVSPKRPSRSHSSPKGQDQSLSSTKMASPLFSPDMSPRRQSRRDSYERSAKTPPYQATSVTSRTDKRIDSSTKIASMDIEDESQTNQSERESAQKNSVSNSDTLHVNRVSQMDTTTESHKLDNNVKSESVVEPSVKSDNTSLSDSTEQWSKPSDKTCETSKLDMAIAIETEIKKELENIESHAVTVPNDSELNGGKEFPSDSIKTEQVCKSSADSIENSEIKSNLTIKQLDVKEEISAGDSTDVEHKTNDKSVEDSTRVKEVAESSISVVPTAGGKQPDELPAAAPTGLSAKEPEEGTTPTKSVPISPASAEKRVSDSDLSDQDSAMLQSFDDCIRALDEKLEQASSIDVRRTPSDSPSSQSTPTLSAPYRDRFKVRKRVESNASIASVSSSAATTTSMPGIPDTKGQPSDIMRSLLSRSSIFDQDTKRLEQIDEKYQPKEYNLNLDRPTAGTVGVNSDHEEDLSSSSYDSRFKDLYTLPQAKMSQQFPIAIPKPSVNESLGYSSKSLLSSYDDEAASDGFGLGPSLTLTPPGSSANQDLVNKFGPQALSRYPFLQKKTSLDLSKTSPPQMGMPTTPDALRSPPILPRDPRRDPTSPPVMVPLSLIRKTPPSASQSGGPSPLSSPTGILKKSEPGPSILKRSEPTTPTSILKKTESFEGFQSPPTPSKKLELERTLNNSERPVDTSSHKVSSNDAPTTTDTQPQQQHTTPSGTGKTAVSHNIEPEKSAVSKNEFCSGDGVQYQSTPSPPVLTKEVKDATSQGIGTQPTTPLKRTASQAFLDKGTAGALVMKEETSPEQRSPPTLTQPLELEAEGKKAKGSERQQEVSSPAIAEPDHKKQRVSAEVTKEQGPEATEKTRESETKKQPASSASSSSSLSSTSTKSGGKVHDKKNAMVKKSTTGSSVEKSDKKFQDNGKKGSTKPTAEVNKKKVSGDNEKKAMLKKPMPSDIDKKLDPRTKDTEKRSAEKKPANDEKKGSDTKKDNVMSKKNDLVNSERKEKNGPTDKKDPTEKKGSETDRKTNESKKASSPSDGKKGFPGNDKKSGDKVQSDDKKSGDRVQDKGNNSERKSAEKGHSSSNSMSNDKKSGEKTQEKSSGNHKASESDKSTKTDRKTQDADRKHPDMDKAVKKSSSDKHSMDKKSAPNEKKTSEKSGLSDKTSSNSERKSQVEDKKVKTDNKSKTQTSSSVTMDKKTNDRVTGDIKSKKYDSKAKDTSSSKTVEKSRHGSDNSSSSLSSEVKLSQQLKDQKVVKDQTKTTSVSTKDAKTHRPDGQKSEKKVTSSGQSEPKVKGSVPNEGKVNKGPSEMKNKVNHTHQGAEVKTKSEVRNSLDTKSKVDIKSKSSSHQNESRNKYKTESSSTTHGGSHNKDSKPEKGAVVKTSSTVKPKPKPENKSPTIKTSEKVNKVSEVCREEGNDKHVKSVKAEKVVKVESKGESKVESKGDYKKERSDKVEKHRSDRVHESSKHDNKYESKFEKGDSSERFIERYESQMDRYESSRSEKYDKYDRHSKDINKNREKLFSRDRKKEFLKAEEKSRSDVWKASMENKLMKDSSRDDKRRLKHEQRHHHHHKEERRRHKSRGGSDDKMDGDKKMLTSPRERKRSSSIAGETRELKQLRESLGIPADQPLQFTSMYDMVKRRTHSQVHKDEVFSPEKQDMPMKKRRGSYDTSNSDSDSEGSSDDSAFSSENKENKKNQSKSPLKTKTPTCLMTSSSSEFSSDDERTKQVTTVSPHKTSPMSTTKKTSPQQQQRRKSVITNHSSQSSNSSADSSDSDLPVLKTPTHASAKRRTQMLAMDSDSADSDREAVKVSKSPTKKTEDVPKPTAREVKRNKHSHGNRVQSSSSSSSSDSDSDSDDGRRKSKGQTVLEKLEESIQMSSDEDSPSSDSSDSSVATPPPSKTSNSRKPNVVKKQASTKHSSDSDDMPTLKKKTQVKSQKGRNIIATSNSESDSDKSSGSDSDNAVKWKNKVKQSPKASRKEQVEPMHKPKKETPPQKPQKQRSPSVSQETQPKIESKSEQMKKKSSPARKHSPKGLRVDTDMTKDMKKHKPHKEMISPKSSETKKAFQEKVKKTNKEVTDITANSDNREEDRHSKKANNSLEKAIYSMEVESKNMKDEDSEDANGEMGEDLNSSNVSDLTEEEKGREEKVNKMQSIFSKSDNIFEKLDFDNDSTKVSSDGEPDHTEGEKLSSSDQSAESSPAESETVDKQTDSTDPTKKDSKLTSRPSTKLFDTSDSESEAEVKHIAEKILVGGDESQDSEILDHVPLLGSENLVNGKGNVNVKSETKEESAKKKEVTVSEPVKNTVVETEKAVNSLVTLLEEVPLPTINETGIVENVEIITEPVEDEEEEVKVTDQVAQDEVANAILSISNVLPAIGEASQAPPGQSQQPQAADISTHHMTPSAAEEAAAAEQIVYQMEPEGNSEAEQAVAALVFDCGGFGDKAADENYTLAVNTQPVDVQPVTCEAPAEQPTNTTVYTQAEQSIPEPLPSQQTRVQHPAVVKEERSEGKEILQSIIDEINIIPPERDVIQEGMKQEGKATSVVKKEAEIKINEAKPEVKKDFKLTSPEIKTKEAKPVEVIQEIKSKPSKPDVPFKSPTGSSSIISQESPAKTVKEEKPAVKKSVQPKPGRRHHETYVPAVSSFEQLFPNIRNDTKAKPKEPEAKEAFNAVTPHPIPHPHTMSLPNDYPGKNIPSTKSLYNPDIGNRAMPPIFSPSQHGLTMPPDLYRPNDKNMMNGPPRSEPQHLQKSPDFPAAPANAMFPHQRGQHLLSSPLFQQRDMSFPTRPRHPPQHPPHQPQQNKNIESSLYSKTAMKPQPLNSFMGLEPQHPKEEKMNNAHYGVQKNITPENKPPNLPFYGSKSMKQEDKTVNHQPFYGQNTSPKDKIMNSPTFYGSKKAVEDSGTSHLYGQKPGFPPASEPYQHLIVKPPILDHTLQHTSRSQPDPARLPYSQQTVEKKRQNFPSLNPYEKPSLQNSLYELQKERFPMEKPKYPQQAPPPQSSAKLEVVTTERKPDNVDSTKTLVPEKTPSVSSGDLINKSALYSNSVVDNLLQKINKPDSAIPVVTQRAENQKEVTKVNLIGQTEGNKKVLTPDKVPQKDTTPNLQQRLSGETTPLATQTSVVNMPSSKEVKRYEPKSKFGASDTSPTKQIPTEEVPVKKPNVPVASESEKADYMIPSTTSVPESDTDRDKDEDEETKDNIEYEKEPEKECISIEGLNDFEDEEDLPDLIIDESPLPRKSTEDPAESKKTLEVPTEKTIPASASTKPKASPVQSKTDNLQTDAISSVQKENTNYEAKTEKPAQNNVLPDMTSPTKPKVTPETCNEVSLNVGEELQGGVLHIAETESENGTQPKLTFNPANLVDTTQMSYPPKPAKKIRVKGKKNHNTVITGSEPAANTTTPLVIETSAPTSSHMQPVPTDKAPPHHPSSQQALSKSPVTRGKAKQEDIVISEPTTPPSSRKRQDSAESPGKFSSRGRKIIPKERGDEITDLTRKSRRSASTGSAASDETKVKVKTRTGSAAPGAPDNNGEQEQPEQGGVVGKKKTWSLRSKKEAEAQECSEPKPEETLAPTDNVPKDGKEEPKEPPIKITLRRTGRRKTAIQKTTNQDGTATPEVAEYTKVNEDQAAVPEEPAVNEPSEHPEPADTNHRPRRHRKAKGKKGVDSTGPATRARKNDGSSSPRSRSSEGSSPKNISKPYVKLEKLNMDSSKREDEDQKDLYEWEDEEEKPLPGYKVARNTRKRKGNDKDAPQKPGGDHPKRSKKTKAEARKEAKEAAENRDLAAAESVLAPKAVVPEPQPEKKEPVPEPRKPDMTDILQDKRGHLPLKLAMKLKSQEAARKENEAKEAAEKAAREQAEQQQQQQTSASTLPMGTDTKDSYDKSEEARIIDKKRGRFINRDEQFSPGVVKDLSRAGTTATSTSAPSSHATTSSAFSYANRPSSATMTTAGLPSPIVIAPETSLPPGPLTSRPPSAPSAAVASSRAFTDPTQPQPIMRVPNSHMHGDQFGPSTQKGRPEVAHSRPSSQPSGVKMSPKPKQADSRQSPHIPASMSGHPSHMINQSLHSTAQQLSPHSVRGQSPRMPVPPPPNLPGFPHPFVPASGLPPQTSPTSQASSELRAALAQPSKLVQQEQLLHQQRLHERQQPAPQHSPHLPEASKGSPSLPATGPPPPQPQHHLPFSEAQKGPASSSHGVVSPHIAATHEGIPRPPDLTSFRHPDLNLAHRDMRNGLPPQAMMIPGMPPIFIPGMPIDPRMIQHQELMAQQQMLGMLPPHAPPPHVLLGQHQPPVADRHPHDQSSGGRPPSRHPTPPTGQPSPRGTPHHPQVSTPLTPQLPQPPIAALPSRPPIAHMSNGLPSDGMAIALQRFQVMWQGYLYLKNDAANVQMHFITGSKALVTGALESVVEGGIVRIAQRMRLEASQLEGVAKRMQKEEEYSMLVAIPCGKDHVDIMHQSNKLQTGFIQYLQQKQAAGIVNIPVQPGYVVHIFPPCEFSSINITQKAPELVRNLNDNSYLVVVITST